MYASDLMQAVWTSENIWFMHEHKTDDNVTCAYNLRAPYLRKLQELSNPKENVPSDLAEVVKSRGTWFNTLKTFNRHIHQLNHSEPQTPNPKSKIAILDTGYKSNMGCFKDYQDSGLIKWQDLASDPPTSDGIDEDGHGSLMAQLVMASAPQAAEVYVIRVASNRQQILNSKSKIAEV